MKRWDGFILVCLLCIENIIHKLSYSSSGACFSKVLKATGLWSGQIGRVSVVLAITTKKIYHSNKLVGHSSNRNIIIKHPWCSYDKMAVFKEKFPFFVYIFTWNYILDWMRSLLCFGRSYGQKHMYWANIFNTHPSILKTLGISSAGFESSAVVFWVSALMYL